MSHLTSHAQTHLADIDIAGRDVTVLADSMPVMATPAAFAAGATATLAAGALGFAAEEAADD